MRENMAPSGELWSARASRALEVEFKCPVCKDLFKDPVMLHCTHHVCGDHLANHQPGSRLECPVCGDVTTVPEGGLLVDRTLQLVRAHWEEQRARDTEMHERGGSSCAGYSGPAAVPRCGFCEERPAQRKCVQCDGVLCEECVSTSHSKGFFKSHTIVDLDSEPRNDLDLSQKMVCDTHKEEKLTFYCLDCRMPVCSHCLILGEHKGHQQKPIESAFETGKETLSAWVEKLQQRVQSTEEILHRLDVAELDVQQGAAAQRDLINHEMDQLKELIETKRTQLLSKSAIEEKQKRAQLQAQVDRTQGVVASSLRLVERSEDLLSLGSEHAFLAVVLPLIQDMKKLSTQHVDPEPSVTGNFRPLLTDAQVRSLGDLDLGMPKQPVVVSSSVQQQAQANRSFVVSQSMPGHATPAHNSLDMTHGYVMQPGYQVSNATVSYLQPQPAQQVQYVYRTVSPSPS